MTACTEGMADHEMAVVHYAYRASPVPMADWVVTPRQAVITDARWYGSRDYERTARVMGIDVCAYTYVPVPGTGGDEVSGAIFMRAAGDPDFTPRERLVIREAHAALAGLIGGPLARPGEPSPAALPPRARAVLRCLLEGDSDKQAAVRLGLSRHTVNDYAKRIFRHFGVTTRAELLARWIKRGWGGRFAWAPDAAEVAPPPTAGRAVTRRK